jgi:hypothetical protein
VSQKIIIKDAVHLCFRLLGLEGAHGDDLAREAFVVGVLDFIDAGKTTLAKEADAVELVFT